MKKWLKWTLLALILLIVSIFLYLRFGAGMDLPEGRSGEEADALAMKMMSAVGDEAWDDTRFVHWTFTGRNTYTWDRTEGMVRLESGGLTVVLDTATRNGWAEKDGEALSGAELENALKDAWAYFCNDSFWLIAPLKAMDPGTEREVVETEEKSIDGDLFLWWCDSWRPLHVVSRRGWTPLCLSDVGSDSAYTWSQGHLGGLDQSPYRSEDCPKAQDGSCGCGHHRFEIGK